MASAAPFAPLLGEQVMELYLAQPVLCRLYAALVSDPACLERARRGLGLRTLDANSAFEGMVVVLWNKEADGAPVRRHALQIRSVELADDQKELRITMMATGEGKVIKTSSACLDTQPTLDIKMQCEASWYHTEGIIPMTFSKQLKRRAAILRTLVPLDADVDHPLMDKFKPEPHTWSIGQPITLPSNRPRSAPSLQQGPKTIRARAGTNPTQPSTEPKAAAGTAPQLSPSTPRKRPAPLSADAPASPDEHQPDAVPRRLKDPRQAARSGQPSQLCRQQSDPSATRWQGWPGIAIGDSPPTMQHDDDLYSSFTHISPGRRASSFGPFAAPLVQVFHLAELNATYRPHVPPLPIRPCPPTRCTCSLAEGGHGGNMAAMLHVTYRVHLGSLAGPMTQGSFQACVHAWESDLLDLNQAARTPASCVWLSDSFKNQVGFEKMDGQELDLKWTLHKGGLDGAVPSGHMLNYSGQIAVLCEVSNEGAGIEQYCEYLRGQELKEASGPCLGMGELVVQHTGLGALSLKVDVFAPFSPYSRVLLAHCPPQARRLVSQGRALLALMRVRRHNPTPAPQPAP